MFCYYWDVLGRWFPYCSLEETWACFAIIEMFWYYEMICGTVVPYLESRGDLSMFWFIWCVVGWRFSLVDSWSLCHCLCFDVTMGWWWFICIMTSCWAFVEACGLGFVGEARFYARISYVRWILVISDLMFWAISSWICIVGWNPTGLIMLIENACFEIRLMLYCLVTCLPCSSLIWVICFDSLL